MVKPRHTTVRKHPRSNLVNTKNVVKHDRKLNIKIKPTITRTEIDRITLFFKKDDKLFSLVVPDYLLKDIIIGRASKNEIDRLFRLSEQIEIIDNFTKNSAFIDFDTKKVILVKDSFIDNRLKFFEKKKLKFKKRIISE